MSTLYNQAIAHRFGIELREMIESGEWTTLDFAVAWARRSGVRHLEPALRAFLQTGGVLRGIIGVDLENTSYEGLEDLLGICGAGDGQIVVYHNEANVTFHPKVYLFSNDTTSRLIVGSNNLTQGGLYTNTEIGLQVDARINDPVILDAQAALESWRDVTSGLARVLDPVLLTALRDGGYVDTEARLRQRIEQARRAARPRNGGRPPLFGNRRVTAPEPPGGGGGGAGPGGRRPRRPRRRVPGNGAVNAPGTVILMRVRRASEGGRRTQIQLPVRKMLDFFGGNFFDGVAEITSNHDGRSHGIREALAGGARNTTKLEVPEIGPMIDPVLRLERTDNAITYEAYDRDTAQGRQIMNSLEEGRLANPPTTMLTINDIARATMVRYV